jgi:hypothetical protein
MVSGLIARRTLVVNGLTSSAPSDHVCFQAIRIWVLANPEMWRVKTLDLA